MAMSDWQRTLLTGIQSACQVVLLFAVHTRVGARPTKNANKMHQAA